jgi:hypothetical protein
MSTLTIRGEEKSWTNRCLGINPGRVHVPYEPANGHRFNPKPGTSREQEVATPCLDKKTASVWQHDNREKFRRMAPSPHLDARWRNTKSNNAKGPVRDFAGKGATSWRAHLVSMLLKRRMWLWA